MDTLSQLDLVGRIVEQTKSFGASLVGIASVETLKTSPSHTIDAVDILSGIDDFVIPLQVQPSDMVDEIIWPDDAKSVLIWAVVHNESDPELDWWSQMPGGTPGNLLLIDISKKMKKWLENEFQVQARRLPYYVHEGGIFLKDAAALAGLGIIGKNNLLITPEYGPRVRLRSMFLNAELESSGLSDFDPCATCDMPCHRACPQNAFQDGYYSRHLCGNQMRLDVSNRIFLEQTHDDSPPRYVVKSCRVCEFACPVAR